MKEKELNPRMQNIYQITRFGTEMTVKIPKQLFFEKNTNFKEQQEALENLKKDPQLEITEEETHKEYMDSVNGEKDLHYYKIITIRRLDKWPH